MTDFNQQNSGEGHDAASGYGSDTKQSGVRPDRRPTYGREQMLADLALVREIPLYAIPDDAPFTLKQHLAFQRLIDELARFIPLDQGVGVTRPASSHDCGTCEALRVLPTWKRWWYRIAYGLYPAHHPEAGLGPIREAVDSADDLPIEMPWHLLGDGADKESVEGAGAAVDGAEPEATRPTVFTEEEVFMVAGFLAERWGVEGNHSDVITEAIETVLRRPRAWICGCNGWLDGVVLPPKTDCPYCRGTGTRTSPATLFEDVR